MVATLDHSHRTAMAVLELHATTDRHGDNPSSIDESAHELEGSEAGRFLLYGDSYQLRWMDTQTARELAQYFDV